MAKIRIRFYSAVWCQPCSGLFSVIVLTRVEIVLQIAQFTSSPSDAYELTQKQRNMSSGVKPKDI